MNLPIINLFALILLLSVSLSQCASANRSVGPWEKLGQATVNKTVDRDVIRVTAREGNFRKIKLKVKRAGVEFHRIIVHYANGTKEEISIRKFIRAGSETRVIDLKGYDRVIQRVVFYYDTDSIRRAKGIVQLWGMH